jgi:hypothetical protein
MSKYITTQSILNYKMFDFLTPSLTTRLIQKFVQNITSFVVAWFINKSSSRMTYIIFFKIRRVVQFEVKKKVKRLII